ncbi:hypothetical protein PISMIDRAFT_214062 [Pisolithus microcarpus 441]|uniref:Ricin B lectin domain-containing protein n=1 Tax=Pisolithus microcarpus 441 TaxID=765257 RepID=A0A0C9YUD9_9AGAM|nr:hypothetical protein PISMIDRAFT_214062 [Pisolithus microcarpus 441]
MHATSTVKNVVYHTAWTEENDDDSSVVKYTKFINENIAAKGGVDQWNYIFNIACMLEAQLFDTGLQHHTLFRIIPDGTYFIHNSSRERVVLAIQKVEGSLQSPFHGSSVVGVDKTGGDNEKWLVDATKNGYMFQNLGTHLYLGVSSEEGRILQAVSEPYYWWINPVPSQPNQGSPLYRIHDSANLRYTLCADNKINLHDSESEKSPSAVSCQTWSYDRLEQLATHTPDPVSMSFVDDKFSSSKRSSERASSDHSSESDYQAKYKELEQKERESRRQYEQQLAEKDRKLQDMKSRQQAIAQEEWKAREALNLEVQRLKSELHRTEETKRHLEEKANEKEREFHRQYEQQLAEKDRRLQDMESRQQATAQEERKAREALNLEVQRLKSKLHGTEETKRHSKEKANEKERELHRRLMFESTVRPDGVE